MNCADVEIRLADYVDETIRGEDRSALEAHLAECPSCSELARDAAAAVAFMERAANVEAPPELVTRILFEITSGPSRAEVRPNWTRRISRSLFGKWLEPILQPRYAMGMAMTVLSFAMLGRFTGIHRQLTAADLDPVKIWMATEDRAQRVWERSIKSYENLRVVFEIQTQLKEWTDEQRPDDKPAAGKAGGKK